MDAARATHFGPGPRLASLAALLRTAAGAPVPVVADLADALALPAGSVPCLVLDLASVPLDDLGLLRRLRARQPGLVILWTGPATLAAGLGAVADAGDDFRPWPLDVTLLPGFRAEGRSAGDSAGSALGRGRGGAPSAMPLEAPPLSAGDRTPPPVQPGSVLDPDLRHIEAILAGFERGGQACVQADVAPSPRAARHSSETVGSAVSTRRPRGLGVGGFEAEERAARHDEDEADDAPAGEAPADEDEDELEELRGHSGAELAAALVSDGPLLTHEELEAFLAPEPPLHDAALGPRSDGGPGPAVRGLPHWYRDQVADLADLVQRAELALHAADAPPEGSPGRNGERPAVLTAARLELGRLRQFARTLGCLAAPPPAGAARLDLGVLVEETLASLAQRAPGTGHAAGHAAGPGESFERSDGRPRFLFRSQAGVDVQADKSLLIAALDAVLGVAAAAGGAADVVRTEVLATEAGVAEVRVDLPEGRLAGLEPARLLEPYALRKRLPGIGPHALAAAGGILVGHGGDLIVERRTLGPSERPRLVFILRLPAR